MEEEAQKFKTLNSLKEETPPSETMYTKNSPSETVDFQHPHLEFPLSPQTLLIFSDSEFLLKEETPVLETMVIGYPGFESYESHQTLDGYPKSEGIGKIDRTLGASPKTQRRETLEELTLDGSDELVAIQIAETLIDSVKEGGEKLGDFQPSDSLVESFGEGGKKLDGSLKNETLAESVKLEDCKMSDISGESVKEGGGSLEDSQMGGTLDESAKKAGEESEEDESNILLLGYEDSEDAHTLVNLENGISADDVDDDINRGVIVNGSRHEEGFMKGCRCCRCLRDMEEEMCLRKKQGKVGLRMDEPCDNVEDDEMLTMRSPNGLKGWMHRPLGYYDPRYLRYPCHPNERHMGCMHRDHCCRMHCNRRDPFYCSQHPHMGRERDRFRYPSSGWFGSEPCPVGSGLVNLGNTCFLNVILQCCTHTVSLVQGLLSLKHEVSSHGADEFCLLCAVRDQIEHSLAYSGKVIKPSNLVDNLSQISSFFQRYQQEDAHEFLQCLLDKLDSHWSKYEASAIKESAPDDSVTPEYTLVRQVFGGRLVSQVRCCKCGHSSNTYESFIDLSLEIEDVDTLESALNSFTKVESIEDTEKFTCGSCKEQVKVEKQLMLDQAPSVAALHLKRFKSDGICVEKIDKKVKFPLELDLSPYTKGSNNGNEDLKYELFGVVVHVGYSSTSGHYFCYIRADPEKWYRFDDSKVTMVSEESVLCEDSYILFYTMKGTPWFGGLIEKWNAECCQKISSASPKSVLDDMNFPSTSHPVGIGFHDFEAGGKGDATGDMTTTSASELRRDEMEIKAVGTGFHDCDAEGNRNATGDTSISPATELMQDDVQTKVDAQNSAVANQSSASSRVPIIVEVKVDKVELDVNLLMDVNDAIDDKTSSEKIVEILQSNGGTCGPPQADNFGGETKSVGCMSVGNPENDVDIKPLTPIRSPSPDIYSDEEPAENAYQIPLDHLKIEVESSSANKSINPDLQGMKKEAVKYIRKMPMGRRQFFLAALNGSHSDSSLSKKRKRQGSLSHGKHSPKKGLKVSPKRVSRPVIV